VATAVSGGSQARQAHAQLRTERAPLLDLLTRLDVRPPLRSLADVLPPLAPRYYSIASAPAADAGKLHHQRARRPAVPARGARLDDARAVVRPSARGGQTGRCYYASGVPEGAEWERAAAAGVAFDAGESFE
ncbi:MAG: hypothetical protein SGPRY_011129, partial [Prymnesium sp.]